MVFYKQCSSFSKIFEWLELGSFSFDKLFHHKYIINTKWFWHHKMSLYLSVARVLLPCLYDSTFPGDMWVTCDMSLDTCDMWHVTCNMSSMSLPAQDRAPHMAATPERPQVTRARPQEPVDFNLHYTALHCTSQHCTSRHCTVLPYTLMYFNALHCTTRNCTVLH